MDRKRLLAFVISIFLILSAIIIPIWYIFFFSGKSVTLDFEYDDNCLLGLDLEVVGINVDIHTPSGEYTAITDVNGQIVVYITEIGEYTYDLYWMNVGTGLVSMDESTSNQMDIELESWSINPTFNWAHDLSAFEDSIDLEFFNGSSWVSVATVDPDSNGELASAILGLTIGEYRFENTNETITITKDTTQPITAEIYVVPIGVMISIIESISLIGIAVLLIRFSLLPRRVFIKGARSKNKKE